MPPHLFSVADNAYNDMLTSKRHPSPHILNDSKGLFTCTVNVIIFVSGTFDRFNAMCEQHHRTALNSFINGTKLMTLTVCVNEP